MDNILQDNKFLLALIETMSEGLMVVDKFGKIVYFNPAAEEITGYKKEDVLGISCNILHTSTCNLSEDLRCSLFVSGFVKDRKCEIIKKDGSIVHLLKNAVVLRDERGNITGAVEVMTDVTSLYVKDMQIEGLKQELAQSYGFMGLIGSSPAMKRLYEQIKNASKTDAPVIICGESGTGKELVAEAIHRLSARSKGPFIKVNCAALNEFLLESELFGHVKGAFTGAIKDRPGRFEAAHNGSIFLDEIGDMSLNMQVKILRVLQEKEIERVGDHRPIKVNTRVITATNKDLSELIENGKFREDLFYRINVIPIHTPPLKERREDIPLLLNHFLKRYSLLKNKAYTISPAAMEALEAYDWPGNVRQLINVLEYAIMTAKNSVIMVSDLPDYLFQNKTVHPKEQKPLIKKEKLLETLNKFQWNRSLAARHLGISRVTLWKTMKALGLTTKKTEQSLPNHT